MSRFITVHYWNGTTRHEVMLNVSEIVLFEQYPTDAPFSAMTNIEMTNGRSVVAEESAAEIYDMLHGDNLGQCAGKCLC